MTETGNAIVELSLSPESLSSGGKVEVAFRRRTPCASCKGSGRKEGAACEGRGHAAEHACPSCERGFDEAEATIEVDVPPHSRAGEQLRVEGKGHVRADGSVSDVVVVLGRSAPPPATIRSNPLTTAIFLFCVIFVLALAIVASR